MKQTKAHSKIVEHSEPVITVPEARLLLGGSARSMTDKEIEERMRFVDQLSLLAIEVYKVHKSTLHNKI